MSDGTRRVLITIRLIPFSVVQDTPPGGAFSLGLRRRDGGVPRHLTARGTRH